MPGTAKHGSPLKSGWAFEEGALSMSELSDRLRAAASGGPVSDSLLSEAADRIDYLERIAGAVSAGDELSDIKHRVSDSCPIRVRVEHG
jgi:hypothetical protein